MFLLLGGVSSDIVDHDITIVRFLLGQLSVLEIPETVSILKDLLESMDELKETRTTVSTEII